MPEKKNDQDANESAVERHVDEMMDPKRPDGNAKSAVPTAPDLPEIDIFKDQKAQVDDKKSETSTDNTDANESDIPVHEPPASEKIADSVKLDGEGNDSLVDDIVAKEGDELLAARDADVTRAFSADKPSGWERIKQAVAAWWDNKPARYGTLGAVLVLVGVAMAIPTSRYAVLNTAGVRVASSLTILDNTTSLPLKNVSVTVGNTTAKTNDDGVVRFTDLKLGSQHLTIKQLGFAQLNKTVVLGLGSNPLGQFNLIAVGTQFKFVVTDYVSGKAVASAEASSGDANAQADDKGQIILTVGKLSGGTLPVDLTASGYRTEHVDINTSTTAPTNVVMVTSHKEVFVSKQSGRYDVYKVDADGKNKQLLLAGTGIERPQITLVSHPTDNLVALVSSRDDKRNQDGYLLDTLTVINVDNGSTLQLDQSEQIRVVNWINDTLIYVKVKAGTSAGNSERYQLMSYDYSSTTRLQLAAANSFADILSAKGVLYYATANYYTAGQSQFVRINPDNTGKQVLLNSQVWNIIRGSYDGLNLAGDYTGNTQNWYSYNLGDSSAKKLSTQPTDTNDSRYYLDAVDGKRALWTEQRDGKGVLLVYDDTTKKDTTLTTQSGLTYPLRWLDSRTVIYRVVTPQETADYVISLDGGTAHKVTDVTNVSGLGPWQYGY